MSKVAVVTGANKGIGLEIVKQLLQTNAFTAVYLAARDVSRGTSAVATLASPSVRFLQLDLESVESIGAAVAQVSKDEPAGVDVLINNAGFAFRVDSTEPFGNQALVSHRVNYYGTKAVTLAFLPIMKAGSRIVNVASRAGNLRAFTDEIAKDFQRESLTLEELDAHVEAYIKAAPTGEHTRLGYSGSAYGNSKAAEVALTKIFARSPQFTEKGITVNAVCPGWCKTDMSTFEGNKTAAEGAETPVWLATDPAIASVTGGFFGERAPLEW